MLDERKLLKSSYRIILHLKLNFSLIIVGYNAIKISFCLTMCMKKYELCCFINYLHETRWKYMAMFLIVFYLVED